MRLAVQWPERREDLVNLAFYFRLAPTRLGRLLRQVREGADPDDLPDISQLVADNQTALDLWNQILAKLDADSGSDPA